MQWWERELAVLLNTQVFLSCCNKKIDISKLESTPELNFDLPKKTKKDASMISDELNKMKIIEEELLKGGEIRPYEVDEMILDEFQLKKEILKVLIQIRNQLGSLDSIKWKIDAINETLMDK